MAKDPMPRDYDSERKAGPEQWWQRVVVPFAASLLMLLVLASSSIVTMALHEKQRVHQRTGLLASEPSATDLILIEHDDKWRGEQFPVVWIEPTGNAEPVLPPGMDKLPEPGQAVVSPGLDRLASRNHDLAARYPHRVVLGMGGVSSGDELLAYVRMPKNRSLPASLAGELSGDTQAVRVRAFGSSSSEGLAHALYPTSGLVPVGAAVAGVIGFLVVPGLIVLAVSLAPRGNARDARYDGLLPLAFGVVGVAALWGVMSPRLERVPLVGHDISQGDLALPWWLLLAELGACGGAIGLTYVLLAKAHSRRTAETREEHLPPRRPRFISTNPMRLVFAAFLSAAFSFAAFSYSIRTIGSLGVTLQFAGIVAAVASVLLLLVGLLREVGVWLDRLESVSARVAGAYIARDPVRMAWPFLCLILAIVVAFAAGGYRAAADHVDEISLQPGGTQAVFVEWLDPRPDDPAHLEDALGTGLVVPFKEGHRSHEHEHASEHELGSGIFLGATCQQFVIYFSGATCDPGAPYSLPGRIEQLLAEFMVIASHDPKGGVVLRPTEDVAASGSVLVLDNAPLEVLEKRVRNVAMRTLPVPYVYSPLSGVPHVSPTSVAWIASGFTVAIIILFSGCLMSLARYLLDTRTAYAYEHHHHPSSISDFSSYQRSALEAWRFGALCSVIVVVGFLAGLVVCVSIVKPLLSGTPMPWLWIGATLSVAAIFGGVGIVLAMYVGTRSTRQSNPK